MRKILVTGAAGFIGSFLCEELISRGFTVVGVDNLFRGKLENLSGLKDNHFFHFEKLDLSDPNNVQILHTIIKKYKLDTVFHLAAINGTQYFYDKSMFVLEQNTVITQNVLAACIDTDINYIIYTSSSEVYGEPLAVPTKENHPILLNAFADRDSYAASKAIGDFYVRLFAKQYNISFLSLRVFNMYGERMVNTRYGQVIPEFIKRMLFEDVFTIIGDGSHTRSFCYVKNAVWAMTELMQKQQQGFLNLGNNQEITILELAKLIHRLSNKNFSPVFLPERSHDHKRRCPDISELKNILPGLRFVKLEEGLEKVISYYKLIK